jgi:hypothetical protein
MEGKRTHFSIEARRVAVELWKAKVPLKKIMGQLQISKKGSCQAVGAKDG